MLGNVEGITKLFKRIYCDIEKQKAFAFTTIENKFLAHALLQLALYSEKQNCCISYEDVQCINDGLNATAMSPEVFVQLRQDANPTTRENIRPETYYFYKCAIDINSDFFNKPRYNVGDFELYKQQFNIAQLIFLGVENTKQYNLPEEIQNCVSKVKMDIKIDNIINMASTTLEIKNIVEKYANYLNSSDKQNDQKLGVSLKKLLNSEEFKEKYKNSEVSNFKLFVIKCIYFIKACIMFFFSTQTMKRIKCNYKDSTNTSKISGPLRDFKDFILKEIQHNQSVLLYN